MPKLNDSSPNNIDQIRQLIFGEQIHDYDRRFKSLLGKMDQLSHTLDEKTSEIYEKMNQFEQDVDRKIGEARESMARELETCKKEIQRTMDELDQDKPDKNLLADRLIDLAMKLKGETLLDQINTDTPDDASN